jgi:hypothetical protein
MNHVFKPRELAKLDPSEEPGVFDVLYMGDGLFKYSPDVYDNEAQALEAISGFIRDGEDAGDWDETQHPGIAIGEPDHEHY